MDPFGVVRFLQSVHSNFLDYVKKHSSTFTSKILEEVEQVADEGSADEFTNGIL